MTAGLLESAATFRQCFWHKVSFVLLNQFDLMLTLLAASFGFHEVNPIMRDMLGNPLSIMLVKLVIPPILAWLVPGKLLIPAVALLAFIVGWNLKELVLFFL